MNNKIADEIIDFFDSLDVGVVTFTTSSANNNFVITNVKLKEDLQKEIDKAVRYG